MQTELERIIENVIKVEIADGKVKINTADIARSIIHAKFMKADVESCPYFDKETNECCSREQCNYQIHTEGNSFGGVYGSVKNCTRGPKLQLDRIKEKDLDEMSEHISNIANLCKDPNNCIGCTLQFCNKEETKRFLSQKI